MSTSPKNVIKTLEKNSSLFFKKHNENFDKLLASLKFTDIKFNSESEYNDENYYTQVTLSQINDIKVSFTNFNDFEDDLSLDQCSELLKLMLSKPNLDYKAICKDLSLESLSLTDEELGDGFSDNEIWLVSFSLLTQNDPEDVLDFVHYVSNLNSSLIPYKYL